MSRASQRALAMARAAARWVLPVYAEIVRRRQLDAAIRAHLHAAGQAQEREQILIRALDRALAERDAAAGID